jgi:hypothetical protein
MAASPERCAEADKAHDLDQLLPWNWVTTAYVSFAA